jgi:hypothetical protein
MTIEKTERRRLPTAIKFWLVAATIPIACSVAAILAFPKMSTAWLSRGPLAVDSDTKQIGTVGCGENVAVPFEIRNSSAQPVRLLGASSSCVCVMSLAQFPIFIGPRELKRIDVELHAPKTPRELRETLIIYSDSHGQPRIPLTIVGHAKGGGP